MKGEVVGRGEHALFTWQLWQEPVHHPRHRRYSVHLYARGAVFPRAGERKLARFHYLCLPEEAPWLAPAYEAFFQALEGWGLEEVEAYSFFSEVWDSTKRGYSLFGPEGWQAEERDLLERLYLLWTEAFLRKPPASVLWHWDEEWYSSRPLLLTEKLLELLPQENPWPPPPPQEGDREEAPFLLTPGAGVLAPGEEVLPLPPEGHTTDALPASYYSLLLRLLRPEEASLLRRLLEAWEEASGTEAGLLLQAPPQEGRGVKWRLPREEPPDRHNLLGYLPWHSNLRPPEEAEDYLLAPWLSSPDLLSLVMDLSILARLSSTYDGRKLLIPLRRARVAYPEETVDKAVVEEFTEGSLRLLYQFPRRYHFLEGALRLLQEALPQRERFTQEEREEVVAILLLGMATLQWTGEDSNRLLPREKMSEDWFTLTPTVALALLDPLREAVGAVPLLRFLLSWPVREKLSLGEAIFLQENPAYVYLPPSWWRKLVEE